jgi:hypothetical protein
MLVELLEPGAKSGERDERRHQGSRGDAKFCHSFCVLVLTDNI